MLQHAGAGAGHAVPAGSDSSFLRSNARSPVSSFSHRGKRSYASDDEFRMSSRKTSRFS